jgi:DNA mismatch repair protein MLH1
MTDVVEMSESQNSVPKIKALPQEVVARIAAGEVIQRPSNAVKELLENCLDAGAKSITILYHQGGLKLIQITDNGHGIAVEDMDIVCRRHTTSKLSTFEDLRNIATFGFRGEALASISHVAHVTITSKTEEQQCAYKAEYVDGELKRDPETNEPIKPVPCAGVRGTVIKVEDLFYNIQTRKSGLANHAEEARRIVDVVTKYALHSTGVSISLRKQTETKTDVHTPQSQSILDNIRNLYSTRVAKEILSLEYENEKLDYKLQAYFTNPNYHEKKSQFILFINKRLVDNKRLKKALSSVFENYIPKGTHPFIFLSITMNPKKLDVNVHPTKEEVIFLREEEIIEEIREKVRHRLLSSDNSRVFIAQNASGLKDKIAQASGLKPVTISSTNSSLTKASSLVRTDSIDKQQGAIELYLEGSKKRPTQTDPVVPRKKMKLLENTHELTSVYNILQELESQAHDGLTKMFRNSVYIGYVSAELSLIQYEQKLYILDIRHISAAFMYQLCFTKFAKIKKLILSTRIDVRKMVKASVEASPEKDSNAKREIEEIVDVLTTEQSRGMLLEYFSLEISEEAKLLAVPQLLENYVPPLHRIPDLLCSVGRTLLSKKEEQECLDNIGIAIAVFHGTCSEWEIAEKDLVNEDSQSEDNNQVHSPKLSGAYGYSQERLSWTIQNIIFPALRQQFVPPEQYTHDGTVTEIASLQELYQSFERC